MKGKAISTLAILAAFLFMFSAAATALPTLESVKINGDVYEDGDNLVVERGDKLDFRIKVTAEEREKDVEIEVDMLGYEYNDVNEISDSSHTFNIDPNETVYKNLNIKIPTDADKDNYDLIVRVGGRTGGSEEMLLRIVLKSARHGLEIKDVIFSPEGEVVAGRALLSTVRIKNVGEQDEDSLRVRVSIPALGVSASDYIDELDEEDSITSEELYLRIPACTAAGVYTAVAEVEYDEGYDRVTKETSIRVIADEACYASESSSSQDKPEKTVLNIGSSNQDLVVGESGSIYPVTVSNMGSSSKVYTVNVDGTAGWATSKVTPSNTMVVGAGETKAMYIYLTAEEEATAGEHMFSVKVFADGKELKEVALKATVAEDGAAGSEDATASSQGWDKVKKGLEVGLIVLVVLLILLALIVGFNKLKGDKDDEGQTYY
ncbi:hypothetical protein H6504_03690 [Candidatus Woesearchaeota archaeon]|nr:hypothetical protein [Candidatus Woesearchaeota archaeon]